MQTQSKYEEKYHRKLIPPALNNHIESIQKDAKFAGSEDYAQQMESKFCTILEGVNLFSPQLKDVESYETKMCKVRSSKYTSNCCFTIKDLQSKLSL